ETVGWKTKSEDHASWALVTTMSAGQLRRGGCISRTETVKVHDVILPAASAAVAWTMVSPSAKNEPDGGMVATLVTAEQRSLACGNGNATNAPQRSGPVERMIGGGQTITGGVTSRTVTTAVQALDAH